MSLSSHEKMEVLLKQLEFPQEIIDAQFKDSELHKVIVFKSKKLWHFHVNLEQVLPFEVYNMFYQKLQTSFQHIANVKLTLNSKNKDCNETELMYTGRTLHINYLI